MTAFDLLHARIVARIEQARREGYDEIEFSTPPQQAPTEIADALLDGLAILNGDDVIAQVRLIRDDEAEQCAQAVGAYSLQLDAEYAESYPEAVDALRDAMQVIRRRIPDELRTDR